MSTGTTAEAEVASTFTDALNADTLPALMRSTWTWDDRALRRDLSALLVQVAAGNGPIDDPAVTAGVRATALSAGARFVATVLGPHLIADLGSPLRDGFLPAAANPTIFDRMAREARSELRPRAIEYLRACGAVELPEEASWLSLAAEGAGGLGSAMRAFGNSDSTAPLRSNVALALQTLRALGREGSDLPGRVERGEIRSTLAAAEQTGSWDPPWCAPARYPKLPVGG